MVLRKLAFPYRVFYRALKKTLILHFLFGNWVARNTIKILLENKNVSLVKTIYRGKSIAVKWSTGEVVYKKPFDLFFDDSSKYFK